MIRLLLALLTCLLIATPTPASDTDTSNGATKLSNKIVHSPYMNCSAGDVWSGTFYFDRPQCDLFPTWRNGEVRSVGEYSPAFDQLVNASPRALWGMTSCAASGHSFTTRTFGMDSDTTTNFVEWSAVWFPRKADNSLDTVNKIELGPFKFCQSFKQLAGIDPGDPTPDGGTGPFDSTPIILDLDGNGVKLDNRAGRFDLNRDGLKEPFPRIVSERDYWLVWDLDGDGSVPNGKYLFGNYSLIKAANGYEVLRVLNESPDTDISTLDSGVWWQLRAWADDGDLIAEPGELIAVSDLLRSISFDYKENSKRDRHQIQHRYHADCVRLDGEKCRTVDVIF